MFGGDATGLGGGRMDPKDRAELDRLLDLAEQEQLLSLAPTVEQERLHSDEVLAEQRALAEARERDMHALRQRRQQVAADAEWIDE